jgi:hypothetical protein
VTNDPDHVEEPAVKVFVPFYGVIKNILNSKGVIVVFENA